MATSSTARAFSSFGTVSRNKLVAFAAVAGVAVLTAAFATHAGEPAPGLSADAARRVLSAAEGWQSEHSDGCPTISQLVEDGQLDGESRTDDAWGNRFRIVCEGAQTSVHSAGPDGRPGTADDMNVTRGSS
jgi:hypothetical protein